MSQDRQPDTPTAAPGWSVRLAWSAPAALAVLFIVVLGGLLWVMHDRALESDRADLVNSAGAARESVKLRLGGTSAYLRMLGQDLAPGAGNDEQVGKRLVQYMADHPELVSVLYVDADGIVRWAVPQDDEQKRLGLPLADPDSRDGFTAARQVRRAVYSGPHTSMRGQPAFSVIVPVLRRDEPLGAFVGVYSCERLLRHVLQREIIHNHHVSLLARDGRVIVALPTASQVDERLVRTVGLDPPGCGISLRLGRYGAGFWGVGLTLLAVLCVSLVVGMAWGMWSLNRHVARRARAEESLRRMRDELAQRVRQRTSDLEAANARLQDEMAERQRAEQQARLRLEELAHVGRVSTMGEMAAGLAHELNQPLGAISTFAEGAVRLIESGSAESDDLHAAMTEVSEQARRAGRIIHRLRAFVANGAPQKQGCDMRQLVAEVVDLVIMDIRHDQIAFRMDLADDLPPVHADRIQIQQVLLNLMRNAIEALGGSPIGQRRLEVGASAAVGGMLEVAVSDTGPPCAPEQIARFFDAFFTTKDSGIGMGLSISRSIIEAHGGHLWAVPNRDRGLTFRFTLPTADEDTHETDPQT